jgi:hypothetical protein
MHVSSLLNPFNPMEISAILNPEPVLQPVLQPALPPTLSIRRARSNETSCNTRLQVQAVLLCKVLYAQIIDTFKVTARQITYIKYHRAIL